MSKQRRRDQTLTVRLTAKEKEHIQKRAATAQMSVTDYFVALSIKTEIRVSENLKPLLIELKRIGNNINQLTAKANSGVNVIDLHDAVQAQRDLYDALMQIAGKR